MSQPFSARRLLLPLVPLYRLALALRELRLRTGLEPVRRLRFPVVSVGNLSAGGAGKTPLTIALVKALDRRGLRVDVLSRGYGRQGKFPARVRPDGAAEEFGDEPLLIAKETCVPVYVARQRFDAGQLAETSAPSGSDRPPIVHLLDDGYQHRQLDRDVNILLVNRQDWQDSLLPAGNLREPLRAARRATVLVIPADDPEFAAVLRAWGWQGPIWRQRRKMEVPTVAGSVVAFCGIARPQQFFAGLEASGLQLAAKIVFADHRRYNSADLERLAAAASQTKAAALITTEKDRVRLGKFSSTFPEPLPLLTAKLRVEIEREAEAVEWLKEQLVPAHPLL
jgi:tetraacyldisaccharide 4'-kinase